MIFLGRVGGEAVNMGIRSFIETSFPYVRDLSELFAVLEAETKDLVLGFIGRDLFIRGPRLGTGERRSDGWTLILRISTAHVQ